MRARCIGLGMALLALPAEAATACPPGRLATRTGPTGITLQVCLDGKYATCVRDGLRLGWSQATVKADCDRKLASGGITR